MVALASEAMLTSAVAAIGAFGYTLKTFASFDVRARLNNVFGPALSTT